MEDWRFQFDNPILTKRDYGDRNIVELYRGEARKLVYELKNLMRFRRLGQLKMTRFFLDGTVITAWSIFGHDFVSIDTQRTVLYGMMECSITLINLPEVVQPMRYPGEIRADEVEGVDYIKTYYIADLKCGACVLKWNMLSEYSSGTPHQLYKLFNPFIFHDPTVQEWIDIRREIYGYGPNETHPYVDASLIRPDDHCIFENGAGEIIRFGADRDGTWIKWKVYTEYSYQNPHIVEYTRTGYGYIEIMPFVGTRIINPNWTPEKAYVGMEAVIFTDELCSRSGRVFVDCCRKSLSDRPVELLWTECEISDWCPAPDTASVNDLRKFQSFSWINMGLKSGGDGCLPYEWNLSGPGELITYELGKKQATYQVPTQDLLGVGRCHERVRIDVRDRCGTTDEIDFKSCCETSSPPAIGYTSLIMGFNQKQTLYAMGGCGPYDWAVISGGGSIVVGPDGNTAEYTSPASNPDCVNHPTILIRDCCGNSATLQLVITNASLHTALRYTHFVKCYDTGPPDYHEYGLVEQQWWLCDGSSDGPDCHTAAGSQGPCPWCWAGPCECGRLWGDEGYKCTQGEREFQCLNCDCGIEDVRTQTMKDEGCCPINPETGLPM